MKVVGLVGRGGAGVAQSLHRVYQWLLAQGIEVLVIPGIQASLEAPSEQVQELVEMPARCDLIVVVGGDGSMLGAARALVKFDTPLLGVNLGRVGFLTDVSPDRLDAQLLPVLKGEGEDDYRTILSARIRRAGVAEVSASEEGLVAINEVLVHSGAFTELLDIGVHIGGNPLRLRADGLMVSTTTGSTAYALSAGGPLIDPSLGALVLVPMLPQSVGSRPIVVPPGIGIQVQVYALEEGDHTVSFDGHNAVAFEPGDLIDIRAVSRGLRLIHPPGYSFYQACRTKLGWMSPARSGVLMQYPAVMGLLAVTALVALVTQLGSDAEMVAAMNLVDIRYGVPLPLEQGLQKGEFWRLLTPNFLHFGLAHLAMNAVMLWEFGRRVEMVQGAALLICLVALTGTAGILAEYVWQGPFVGGGLSSAVYGLLGYCWLCHRRFGIGAYYLMRPLVVVLLVGLLIGMSGLPALLFGVSFANAAHVGGLVAGLLAAAAVPAAAKD